MKNRPITISRRSLLQGALGVGGLALIGGGLASCSSGGGNGEQKIGATLEEIIELAQKEGKVHLIAYPDDWANYKKHFEAFTAKYGVKVEVSNPTGSSAEELQTTETMRGRKEQPDVLDIGYTFTDEAIERNLIEAYKPTTFNDTPTDFKHPDGMWVAAYYGVVQWGVNTANVPMPTRYEDLLEPEYRGAVAMAGDPREGALDVATLFSAALALDGGLDNIEPGIDFFAKLKQAGNLVSVSTIPAGLSTQECSVGFHWNYSFTGMHEELAKSGVAIETGVPENGAFANYYAQPVTIQSPQPNAARLWVEWLNSDEGADIYAQSGAIPARYNQLADAGKLSAEAQAAMPSPEELASVTVGDVASGKKAAEVINAQWGPKVVGQ